MKPRTVFAYSIHILGCLVMLDVMPATPAASAARGTSGTDIRQQLAEKYAPILMLRTQAKRCSIDGEPYYPMPVEAVLGDPAVALRQAQGRGPASSDRLLTDAPGPHDVAWLGQTYYLDLPGNPLEPGCAYERWSRSKEERFPPTIYAHIATQHGEPGIALQYWFLYAYNDFNNRHESDWEMIQLTFDEPTAEAALRSHPVSVTYAQHGGGERTDWDDTDTLTREGDRPIVYPAAGSHASYFGQELYIGWGNNGTGFGCDNTLAPSTRVDPQVIVVPDNWRTNPQFRWLTFAGRWGEKQPWEYNGPFGPARGRKWREPITWIDTVRERSLALPTDTSGDIGPMPGDVFCSASRYGSHLLMLFAVHPKAVATATVAGFALVAWFFTRVRRRLARTLSVYLGHWTVFTALTIVLVPLAIVASSVQTALAQNTPVEWVVELVGRSDAGRALVSRLVGSVSLVVQAVIIGPMVITVVDALRRRESPPAFRDIVRRMTAVFPLVFRTWLWITVVQLLRIASIVGIPWAIRDLVRWAFVNQAIMVEGAGSRRGALATSATAVTGRWWRTLVFVLLFEAIAQVPGPLVTLLLLISEGWELTTLNVLSSVITVVTTPFQIIGLTVLYLDMTGHRARYLRAIDIPWQAFFSGRLDRARQQPAP